MAYPMKAVHDHIQGFWQGLRAWFFKLHSGRRGYDTVIAWYLSVAIHVVLIIIFSGVTWLHGLGRSDEGLEVAVVYEGKAEAIAPPTEGPAVLDAAVPGAETVRLADSMASFSQAITEVDLTVHTLTESPVIAAQMSEAAAGVSDTDWGTLAVDAAGGAGGGASFFGLYARGRSFVYVVDHSGSMEGEPLEAAKNELVRSLSALESDMKFYVLFYNDSTLAMPGDLLEDASVKNLNTCRQWIATITSGGGTDPTDALSKALAFRPDAIWLLSDGLFSDSVCDHIAVLNSGGRVQIHTIAFYDNAGEAVLQRIARENRGVFRFVPRR